MTILTIDFEASCLPRHGRSFPIEVGIAGGGLSRSWLIRPAHCWAGWDWTLEAEALHGLSQERISQDGLPADRVLAELAACVQGRRVIADSPLDRYWLDQLAAAAGVQAPFSIDLIGSLFDEQQADEARILAAVAHAHSLALARHRAESDALWLAALIDHLLHQPDTIAHQPVLVAAQ